MEKEDRAKIDQCVDKMKFLINMESIWPRLFVHEIFKKDYVSVPKWKDKLTDPETKRDILLKIKTRGPNAFKDLIKCLRETRQENLIALLENPQSAPVVNINNAARHQISANNNTARSQLSTNNNFIEYPDEELSYNPIKAGKVLEINVKKSKKFTEIEGEILYPMRSNPRGLVLIITNIKYISSDRNRPSAQHDHDNLVELFRQMGFEVIDRTDLPADKIREVVKEFSQNRKLRKVDCSFVIISGHGDATDIDETDSTESVIHGSDHTGVKSTPHKEIKYREITKFFTAEKCPYLAGKPKVFIFQACRGKREQKALSYGNSQSKPSTELLDFDLKSEDSNEEPPKLRVQTKSVRNCDDMIICYSTLPNHVSFRDSKYGSWFVQILCEVFMKRAHRVHLLKMFQTIDERLKELKTEDFCCQTATTKIIGFVWDLYINPGYFE